MGPQLLDNLQALLLGSFDELLLLLGGVERHLSPGLLVVCYLVSSSCVTIGFAMVLLGSSSANLTILMFSIVGGLDAKLDRLWYSAPSVCFSWFRS
jgi:hypothetical protein